MIEPIIDLAKRFIGIPSTRENPEALQTIVDAALEAVPGFKIEKYKKHDFPSVLVHNGISKDHTYKVILNAHLDVVPGTSSQYKATVKDGYLTGRGSYDMKTAASVLIHVFKELAHTLPYPLALQLVTDEEIGGFDGVKHQIEKGVKTEFVLVGEPTDFLINNKMKGVMWLEIITKGKTAHASYPWHGVNAIAKMNSILNSLHAHYPVPEDIQWVTTMNVACIESTNKTFNKVPDACQVGLDIRYIPEDAEKVLPKIKSALPESTELKSIMNEPSAFTEGDNEYIDGLKKATEKIRGKPSPLNHQHFGSDIRHYTSVGIPAITFGPKGSGMHSDEERVDIKSVEEYYLILKTFLQSLS